LNGFDDRFYPGIVFGAERIRIGHFDQDPVSATNSIRLAVLSAGRREIQDSLGRPTNGINKTLSADGAHQLLGLKRAFLLRRGFGGTGQRAARWAEIRGN